jgi:predicted membrane channel-forming protein YqfA (hemolysin III family)
MRGSDAASGGDSFPERLVKYVPAETLAFFVPVAALLGGDHQAWLIVALVVGVFGTFGYLLQMTPKEADDRPRPHYYVLACLAFLSWAIGTTPAVADLIHLDQTGAAFVLAVAVFLIPLADALLNRL